mgnify:CR=1 FL=1
MLLQLLLIIIIIDSLRLAVTSPIIPRCCRPGVSYGGPFHLLIATYENVELPADVRDYSFYFTYYEPLLPGD